MELNQNKKDGALPSEQELNAVKKFFPDRDPLEAYQWWDSVGFPVSDLMNVVAPVDTPIDELPPSFARTYGEKISPRLAKYFANKRLSGTGMSGGELAMLNEAGMLDKIPELMNRFAREVPIVEFTPKDANLGVFGDVPLGRYRVKAEDFTEQSAQKISDAFTTGYGLKTLPFYFHPLTEPFAIAADIAEGIYTRDPLQTGTAALLSKAMSPRWQTIIAAGSAYMPFDAEAIKIDAYPQLFSSVVEKIRGYPEGKKLTAEGWFKGMKKGNTTVKINGMDIPIKGNEVDNMIRLINKHKLEDKVFTKDEFADFLEDKYYTSFISEKTSPNYYNDRGELVATKIELPKDGDVPRDLLEIARYY